MKELAIWDECLKSFEDSLTDKQMRTYFHPLEVTREDNQLIVVAPNKFIMNMIEKDYMEMIKNTVYEASNSQISNVLLCIPAIEEKINARLRPEKEKATSSLNTDLIFDNFVEGKSNQLAKAACVSVVNELGQYNPLYIYGGVGLG